MAKTLFEYLAKATMALSTLALITGCATYSGSESTAAKGEARLAAMLEGRSAGEPQSCISARIDSRLKVIDETALVYDAGDTIYVPGPKIRNRSTRMMF